MKRKLFVITLALVLAFTMTAVPAFAASKVVETEAKYYSYDNGSWTLLSENSNTYNSKGLKTKTVSIGHFLDSDDEGNPVEKVEKTTHSYKYTKGNCTSVITKRDGKTIYKTVTKYNKKNHITKETSYTVNNNGKFKKSSVTEYTYYKNNPLKVTYKITNYDSGSDEPEKYKGTLTYYKNDKLKKDEKKGINNKYKSTWYFNKKGNVTKIVSYDPYDSITYTTEYKYNSKGLPTKEIYTSEYNDPMTGLNKETTKTTYKYSNFYKNKYPRTIITYVDGKKDMKSVIKYKTVKS